LAGDSFGGALSIQLALKAPKKYKCLILFAPAIME